MDAAIKFCKEDVKEYLTKYNAHVRHYDYKSALALAKSMRAKVVKELDRIDDLPDFPKKVLIYSMYNGVLENVDNNIRHCQSELYSVEHSRKMDEMQRRYDKMRIK